MNTLRSSSYEWDCTGAQSDSHLRCFKVQSDVTWPILSPLDVIQKIEHVSESLDNTAPSVLDMCQ